jgi:zinc transporter 1/2/3
MDITATEVARLVLRQDASPPETMPSEQVVCSGSNDYDGRMGIRISAIFVILIGSTFGKSTPPVAMGLGEGPQILPILTNNT